MVSSYFISFKFCNDIFIGIMDYVWSKMKKIDKEATKMKKDNVMRKVNIEKVVLSISSTGETLEKGARLLEKITGRKAAKRKSRKRIPSLGVRPGLEVGCLVTLRGEKAEEILRRLLVAVDNQINRKQISINSFSFGIKEYIEIPGMQYQRDVGILGFDVSVAFTRTGRRIAIKKIKSGKIPTRQHVSKEEIEEFLKNKLNVEVI